jgi:large subunit ribosomal protein L22
MEVNANLKFIRMSPRKMRVVADAVRGMTVEEALAQLKFINKRAAKPIEKVINSAVANAEHNFEITLDNLRLKTITVDEGPTLDRWMPRAHGRATPVKKRTSHIKVVLAEIKESVKKEAKKQKIEAPVKLGSQPAKENKVEIEKTDTPKESIKKPELEKGKLIEDPRQEGRGGHTKIEGGAKGFASKVFRRKSG